MPLLSWFNRDDDLTRVARAPYRLLEPVVKLSYGEEDSTNMLIEGDNLEALKALRPYFGGEVKLCYLDPPYNSKTAFEHYDDNLEHSQWLSEIYPRLELVKELLSDEGVVFVSIDDQEGHYLKVIMDEIFGRKNFVATFIWQKVDSPNDNKPPVAADHEFVLCYEKVKGQGRLRKLGDTSVLDAYPNRDASGRAFRDRLVKKNGKNSLRTDRPTMWFPLQAPDGTEVWPMHDDGREARWALGKKGVSKAIKENTLIWKQREKDGQLVWVPYKREFAPDEPARPHPTILLDVKTSRQAKAHQKDLLPDEVQFDTVKPEQLLQRLMEMASKPGDLILDAYLGTGTTASVAHKLGRAWIGIEQGTHMRTHCVPRLTQVVDGEQGGVSEDIGWEGGGGFSFYKLGVPVFDENGHIREGIRFEHLAAHIWFAETSTARSGRAPKEAYLGEYSGVGYYLLYNGILGDLSQTGGNVLTRALLRKLPKFDGPKVIYGEACVLSDEQLRELDITFKQTPYDIKAR
ncbi:TPA: site-specific DNA-methyltransferase [Pseudomonas aeruginosa]|nr:site-specific DNA-methyltransferase [Pseudomonas aeruginosa]